MALCHARLGLIALAMAFGAMDPADAAQAKLTLFYPGPTGFEDLLTQADHSGADKFRAGKSCRACHAGEERASGVAMIAQDKSVMPALAAKPPSQEVDVTLTRTAEALVVTLSMAPQTQPDLDLDGAVMKVAFMLGDASIPEIGRGGCFSTCHDDLASMPKGQKDATKYLGFSRKGLTRQGGGENLDSAALDALRAKGAFLDYTQARLLADDKIELREGTILDQRREVTATATAQIMRKDGRLTLTFTRPLTAGAGRLALKPDTPYFFGVSLHAGHAARRYHYVSLEQVLKLGATDVSLVTP